MTVSQPFVNRQVTIDDRGPPLFPLNIVECSSDNVTDLVIPEKLQVGTSDGKSIFSVSFKPGEGRMFSLGVDIP